jgi:hypothetical protein
MHVVGDEGRARPAEITARATAQQDAAGSRNGAQDGPRGGTVLARGFHVGNSGSDATAPAATPRLARFRIAIGGFDMPFNSNDRKDHDSGRG